MSTVERVMCRLATINQGSVFSAKDLLQEGARSTIDQALHRLVRLGKIRRVARGLYAHQSPQDLALDELVKAHVAKTGEQIACVGNRYVTSGPSRRIKMANQEVTLEHMNWRKIELTQTDKGLVLLDLWLLGEKNQNLIQLKQATANWIHADWAEYAHLVPAWLLNAIEQAHRPRKSVRIGLVGPYDWSNTNIKDDVLITKVLSHHRYRDVIKICAFYGLRKVKKVWRALPDDSQAKQTTKRMLKNITEGFRQSRAV